MTKEEIAKQILDEFDSEESYYLQVRVYNNYSEEALNRLLDLIEKYRLNLGDDHLIDRRVAYWLDAIRDILEGVQVFYKNSKDPKEAKTEEAIRKIRRATTALFNGGWDETE